VAKHAEDIAKVLQESFKEREGALVAHGFFGLLEASELEKSGAAGFVGSKAGAEIVVDVVLEMGRELVV
jgi:hypothetical protein